MATRLGIELTSAACRIIEIDSGPGWRRARESRIRSFAVLPSSGPETDARLASYKGRAASVIVWGPYNDHRQVVVTRGSYESMRTEALGSLSRAGVETHGVFVDIAPAAPSADKAERRPVVVALAAATPIMSALQPIIDAGIRVRSVATPATALSSLARLRRSLDAPGIEAYVAVEEDATCIAVNRGGTLIAGRELPWGYFVDRQRSAQMRRREDIAARLAEELGEFFAAADVSTGAVGQVCVCGGMSDLRSMTVPLMERLDVEVEPLDSLFSIDAAHVPEPADEFRDRASELRLAWAVAADWPPSLNLLRGQRRQASRRVLATAAVIAGVAAGLGVAWQIQQSAWWRSPAPTAVATNASNNRPGAPPPTSGATARPAPLPSARVSPPALAPPSASTPQPKPTPPSTTAAPQQKMPAPALPATSTPASPQPKATPPSSPQATVSPAPPPPLSSQLASRSPREGAAPLQPTVPAFQSAPPRAAETRTAPRPAPRVPDTPPAAPLPPPRVLENTPAPPPPPRAAENRPAAPAAPPPATTSRPTPQPIPLARSTAPPASLLPVGAVSQSETPRGSTALRVSPQPVPPQRPGAETPFQAELGTILYSADRKLAIVDGRIVAVGDEVRGARIVDITPSAVLLRDGQGRLRRLGLSTAGK